MNTEIQNIINSFLQMIEIVEKLVKIINENLPEAENKIWHSHPVWFLEKLIVGHSKQKAGMRLMFWSGKSFEEESSIF